MDLANLDLDEKTSSSGEESHVDSGPVMVEAPLHNKTEDLHLYFRQSFIHRVGLPGLFIISSLAISFLLITGILLFSYTDAGRSFLGNLSIIII